MLKRLLVIILALHLSTFAFVRAGTPSGADEVLQRFEGRWRTHVVIAPAKIAPRTITANGTGVGLVTLGGQYVEYRAITDAVSGRPPDEDLQINTWDEVSKCYRHWLFESEGNRFQRVGTLDKTRRVLTWTADELDGTVVIHDRFVSADRIEWDLVRRDRSGRVTMRIDALMTRLK